MKRRPDAPLPVTILTGFLGSGKTTLVNRLLKELPGRRFGLVANEFGEAALESQLIEARHRPLEELPAGCLCCVSEGDLQKALASLVLRDPHLDHVLVEASGLSSPGPLLAVLADDGAYSLSGVFGVVDASTFLAREPEFPTVRKQLSFADAVLLTKTDLAPAAAVRQRLAELRPGLRVFDARDRLPWDLLFEGRGSAPTEAEGDPPAPRRRFHTAGRHHDAQVFEFEADEPLDPEALAAVYADLEPGILRSKGILWLDDPSARRWKYLVQFTGGQRQLYSRPWSAEEPRRTALVFLGTDFDAPALEARLRACLRRTPT